MIGIIGLGRFGGLMASGLTPDFKTYIYNRTDKAAAIKSIGGIPASLPEVCRQDYIVLSVPISIMESTLRRIAPLVKKTSTIIDVCSVKVYPVQWMKDILPPEVSILGTHPMFGPDSAADSLQGRKIVISKVRLDDVKYEKIIKYLTQKKLVVIEATPEEHDRQIATTLSLTHFIGRTLAEFGAHELEIDTEGYKRLLHILGVVENDSWQLFLDMNCYNPYAKDIRHKFIDAMHKINQKIDDD